MFSNLGELMNKINVGVELIVEGELIYLAASEDKEQKYDITPDAYAAVFHSMAAHAQRLGGDCAIAFPGGTLQFKKRDRRVTQNIGEKECCEQNEEQEGK